MNHTQIIVCRLLMMFCILACAIGAFAQNPAPTLPPGMTGANPNDQRSKLSPGLYNAGEAAIGM